MRKRLLSLGLVLVCLVFLLTGCGSTSGAGSNQSSDPNNGKSSEQSSDKSNEQSSNKSDGEHEPITFLYSVTGEKIIEVVHEKYPEINLQQIPYGGGNNSWYTLSQMTTGEMPDLFNTSYPWLGYGDAQAEHLVDLSAYSFTDNILPTQIRDVEVEGKVMTCSASFTIRHCLKSMVGRYPPALRN